MTKNELKSIIYECIEESIDENYYLTEEDIEFLDRLVEESDFEDAVDEASDAVEEALMRINEGANIDSDKEYRNCKKRLKENLKEFKKAIKDKDVEKAKKIYSICEKDIDDTIDVIKHMAPDTFGRLCGNIIGLGTWLSKYALTCLAICTAHNKIQQNKALANYKKTGNLIYIVSKRDEAIASSAIAASGIFHILDTNNKLLLSAKAAYDENDPNQKKISLYQLRLISSLQTIKKSLRKLVNKIDK